MWYRYLASLVLVFILITSISGQNLISIEDKGQRSKEQLTQSYGVFIQNGVRMWKITYTTPDVFNQLDTASGLLVIPVRDETTIYPLAVYQHGTVDGPQDVPSNLQGGYELGVVLGGMGYATVAPDFLGAGEARGFHPYVHADSEASAAIDMIRAVRAYAPEMNLFLNDQVFVTGYSQGGHASMALHRALELEIPDIDVTAATHLSGPYSISGIMREVMIGDVPYNFLAYLPNTYLSYNYVYGLYDNLEQFFKPEYVPDIQAFYDGDIGLFTLNTRLINAITDAHGAPIAHHMLQDSIVEVLTAAESDHPVLQALIDNDTYNWAPQQPTRIFYCTADDQVNYRNSLVADSVMTLLGAVDLDTRDVEPTADHGGCVEPAVLQTILFFAGFAEWVVNTNEVDAWAEITVFPNPIRDVLTVTGLQEEALLRFIDMQGHEIWRTTLPEGQVQVVLPKMVSGVYGLLMETKQGQRLRKVVVN